MMRRKTAKSSVTQSDSVQVGKYIQHGSESASAERTLLPPCMVTFVFPSTSESITTDVAGSRQRSWFINECIEQDWFDACGRRIYLLDITPAEFEKYTSWVQFGTISTRNLKAPPPDSSAETVAYLRQHEQCLVIDRLVHWWVIGDAMQDDGLKAASMAMLNKYSQERYELPIQSFEHGWARSRDGSELRRWIFNMLKQTLTLPILKERAEHMPPDMIRQLFISFMEAKNNDMTLISPKASGCDEASS